MLDLRDLDPKASERHRRALLAAADELLGEIELLRLHERTQVPAVLRQGLRALQLNMGRADVVTPASVRAAQNLVFGLQQRLMAANPRRPDSGAHPGRAGGMPAITPIRPGIEWKLLVLPPCPGTGRDGSWLALIESTLERACDRWAYANHHAGRAVRKGQNVPAALAIMRVAWNNFWELSQEAEHIRTALAGSRAA